MEWYTNGNTHAAPYEFPPVVESTASKNNVHNFMMCVQLVLKIGCLYQVIEKSKNFLSMQKDYIGFEEATAEMRGKHQRLFI